MLNSRISLLITDDPDDQQAFSEALNEIAPEWILVIVSDINHAVRLLDSKKFIPDRIFVDLSMDELDATMITTRVNADEKLKNTPVVLYDQPDGKSNFTQMDGTIRLSKDYSYQELKIFLKKELRTKS
jgi:CheY-like chemotaxis protein